MIACRMSRNRISSIGKSQIAMHITGNKALKEVYI